MDKSGVRINVYIYVLNVWAAKPDVRISFLLEIRLLPNLIPLVSIPQFYQQVLCAAVSSSWPTLVLHAKLMQRRCTDSLHCSLINTYCNVAIIIATPAL